MGQLRVSTCVHERKIETACQIFVWVCIVYTWQKLKGGCKLLSFSERAATQRLDLLCSAIMHNSLATFQSNGEIILRSLFLLYAFPLHTQTLDSHRRATPQLRLSATECSLSNLKEEKVMNNSDICCLSWTLIPLSLCVTSAFACFLEYSFYPTYCTISLQPHKEFLLCRYECLSRHLAQHAACAAAVTASFSFIFLSQLHVYNECAGIYMYVCMCLCVSGSVTVYNLGNDFVCSMVLFYTIVPM